MSGSSDKIWGYDTVNKKWGRVTIDADGHLQIDISSLPTPIDINWTGQDFWVDVNIAGVAVKDRHMYGWCPETTAWVKIRVNSDGELVIAP